MKETFRVSVVREGVERLEGRCVRESAPSVGDRMKWFVEFTPPVLVDGQLRQPPPRGQEPYVVVDVREADPREELVGDDLVIVLAPLPDGIGPSGSGTREPRRPRPAQGSAAARDEPLPGDEQTDAIAPQA